MKGRDVVELSVAAERLGRPHRWLRRHLQAVERTTGKNVLIPSGLKRPRYYVHMGRLRLVSPQLFDVRDDIAKGISGWRMEIQRELAALRESLDELGANVAALSVGFRKLRESIDHRGPPGTTGAPKG